MRRALKKLITRLWFQPYTPIIFIVLIALGFYHFGYPYIAEKAKSGVVIRIGGKGTIAEDDDKTATISALINKVKGLMELPEEEEPEIVTITDIEKFKDQPFFKKANNGDKLLIYKNSRKAILYDANGNRILDVGPIADATESARQLQEYCVAWATQSAQLSSTQPTTTPVLGAQTTVTPTAQPTTPVSPTPAAEQSIATPTP